jgi:hypothetical protein
LKDRDIEITPILLGQIAILFHLMTYQLIHIGMIDTKFCLTLKAGANLCSCCKKKSLASLFTSPNRIMKANDRK